MGRELVFRVLRHFLKIFRTPLSPRDQIVEALDDILSRNAFYVRNAIVLAAQIDDFDGLNRRYSGDEINDILRCLERRLKGGILQRDMVRHLDAGQFAIVLSPLHGRSENSVLRLAGQIQDAFAIPLNIGEHQATVTASIGCAFARTGDLKEGRALLEAARIAQMDASANGPCGLRFYSSEMGAQVEARRQLGHDIQAALQEGEIIPYFQPQISLRTKDLSGFEILARWSHSERGLISPAVFLPLLEEAGLMRQLGLQMLEGGLDALQAWDDLGLSVPHVSINMSAEELAHPDVVAEVKALLNARHISPSRLVIEVLETVSSRAASHPISRNLAKLADLGCHIDLDDFGTGHASIKSMHGFLVDRIKIDRSYISNVDNDPEQQQVVATILSVAAHMRVETVAEGVETTAEVDHLAASGCGHAQGFIIAKPLPRDEVLPWSDRYFAVHKPASVQQTVH